MAITGNLENSFVVESTMIESVTYVTLKTNVRRTNRMGSTKWTYQMSKYVYLYFSKVLEFYLRVLFPVSILKTYSAVTIRNDFNKNVPCFMRAVLLFLHVQ